MRRVYNKTKSKLPPAPITPICLIPSLTCAMYLSTDYLQWSVPFSVR